MNYTTLGLDLAKSVFHHVIINVNNRVMAQGKPRRILVLAVLKQGLNCDYDRLTDYANEHGTLHKIMGHGIMRRHYERQSIVDNVSLVSHPAAGEGQPTAGSVRPRGGQKKGLANSCAGALTRSASRLMCAIPSRTPAPLAYRFAVNI